MSVTITSPAGGATVSGTIPVTATFSGQRFTLATLTVDGTQVGAPDTAQPIAFSVDTTRLAEGPHLVGVSVKYRLASGLYRWQKASVTVTVKNYVAPPPVGWPVNPYPRGSVWNPGGSLVNPQVDPNSSRYVAFWLAHLTTPKLVIGPWSVPVVQAKGGEPTYVIKVVNDGHAPPTINALGPVPIPVGTKPDPGGDGHLSVLDLTRGIEWGFWRAKWDGTDWWCTGGNALHLTDQAGPNGFNGANTANFPAAAGLVTPEEIRDGHITRPLVFASNNLASPTGKVYRCPATYGYGSSSDPYALTAGMWLQLDPATDITGLSGWARVVAKGLQEYGAFVRDQTGGGDADFYAENTINRPSAPSWASLGLSGNSVFPSNFPWSRMRVLVPPC